MVTLTGTGTADTYTWDGGVTDATPFLAVAGTTTYTVTGEFTATGCTQTDAVDVTMTTVDEGVTVAGATITSDQAGGTYQWIDCADTSDVTGATNQAFTPTQDGDYAVIVTVGPCSDTSACETISGIGFGENGSVAIKMYPNPATTNVSIFVSGNFTYEVSSLTGAVLISGSATDKETINVEKLARGAYFVKITQNSEVKTLKLVRE
jgi:Secretion system C-terminal sorting domain